MAEKKFVQMKEFQNKMDTERISKEILRKDFEAGREFGRIRIGEQYLFQNSFRAIYYIPVKDIVWAYARQEDSSASLCCGRAVFPTYFLVIHDGKENSKKMTVESSDLIKEILSYLKTANNKITVGYYKKSPKRQTQK